MKKLFLVLFLLALGSLAFGQNIPVCNALAVPPVTTNCTDYFGTANWANSPLPSGTLAGFTLISGGSGYTNPVVVVNDPTGATLQFSGPAAVPVVAGNITAITGTGGAGYIMPQVTIVDVGPTGSLASPQCDLPGTPACGTGAIATAIIGPPYVGGMLKFQDALKSLAIATPDTTTYPGSDFYIIALVKYTQQMHSSLPPTNLRGYCQLATPASTTCDMLPASYLGPLIIAQKDRAVRVLFKNMLPNDASGGKLPIPTDTTYMGAGLGPDGKPYAQNRATLHLHGGATPWISDGTPHQWTASETETVGVLKGLSASNVPDMWFNPTTHAIVAAGTAGATNNPGPGRLTFYWTNQQGGRLMFYHDHAYGTTRLNVYAGEAAGYLIFDPVQEAKLATATAPGTIPSLASADLSHVIPLVIQDRTFVPGKAQLDASDPTWDGNFGATPVSTNLNGNGDLWFPHVYMPNQNPFDPTLSNGFGRWDYGAWFFPPQNTLTAANPPSAVTVPCTSSVFPGQLIAPSTACPNCGCPITPNPSGTPEGFMDTPVVNGVAYPVLHVDPVAYRFQILDAANDRSLNLSWFVADPLQANTDVKMVAATPPFGPAAAPPLCTSINPVAVPSLVIGLVTGLLDATGNPLNGTGLPAGCWPNYGPQLTIPKPQTMWAADGRAGGAPDPLSAGPAWIQIGTEGGLLPAPVVIPPTPVNYEQNMRSITVTSVAMHGLWLGPAERADVIVDFSKFSGKTLILYNDAPAPAPANDWRVDYFTNDGDQTPVGGAPNTPVGYGPNIRTVMQVIVDGTGHPNATPFSLPALSAAFATTAATGPGVFAVTQPQIIVPEAAYNSAYNTVSPNTYMTISADTLTFKPTSALTFNQAPCAATAPATCAVLDQKAIQELFTLDYGRMNATMGTEVALTNFQTQTTVPLGYVDWPTELIQAGQTQLWKITHNGVDSHFIHFHLFNVQVINRVGWDGSNRPPDANELGWKDTVRMNPLEDVLVAIQPITPTFPFPLPDSIRPNDVTVPVGTPDPDAISGLDPNSGNATLSRVNQLVNFGWEYVWHCHILGHEENDMMRPIIFQVAPPAPTGLSIINPGGGKRLLQWTDMSASETSFTVQRSSTAATWTSADPGFASFLLSSAAAAPGFNTKAYGQTVSMTDNTAAGAGPYYYRVRADDNFQPLNVPSPTAPTFQQAAMSSAWNTSLVTVAPSTMISPTPGSTLAATPSITFTWTTGTSVIGHELWIGTTPGSSNLVLATGLGLATSYAATFTPPASSTIYVRLRSLIGAAWVVVDYTYTTPAGVKSAMLTPTPGSVLTSTSSVPFTWTVGYGVSLHSLWVGTSVGGNQIYQANNFAGTSLSPTLVGVAPSSTLYVRLWSLIGTSWVFNDYTYTAPSTSSAASTMVSPTPGTTLASTSVTFTWTAGSGVTDHFLYIGTTPGANNIINVTGLGTSTSYNAVLVGTTPGTTLYVRIYSLIGTTWFFNAYTYTAPATSLIPSAMLTPAPGATLPANPVTFTWSLGSGVTLHSLWIGTALGGTQLNQVNNFSGTSLSVNVGAATSGTTLYVRLWSLVSTKWVYNDYTYKAH